MESFLFPGDTEAQEGVYPSSVDLICCLIDALRASLPACRMSIGPPFQEGRGFLSTVRQYMGDGRLMSGVL